MSNVFTVTANLCADPESVSLGEKQGMRLRLADNTGKKNGTRFFNALVTGYDAETAGRLAKGDKIVLSGQLVVSEYKAKKTTKTAKKGEQLKSDEMPFARIVEVVRSPSYFNQTEATETEETDEEADDSAPEGMDDPLAGL